jgi:hypothetical protein
MDLQPLTSAVLDPSLRVALKYNGDAIGVSDLPFWYPVSDMGQVLGTIQARFVDDNYVAPSEPHPRCLELVTQAVLGVNIQTISDIQGLLDAFMQAGLQVFYYQLELLVGDASARDPSGATVRKFTPQQKTVITRTVDGMVSSLQSKMPFKNNMTCQVDPIKAKKDKACTQNGSIITDISMFFQAAVQQTLEWLYTNLSQDMVEWLFPDDVITLFILLGLGPWLAMSYVASFVHGAWNVDQRHEVSFYDQRYAKLLIYTSMFNAIKRLANLNAGKPDVYNALLDRMNALNIMMMARAEAESGGDAVLNMYTKVATLSTESKQRSVDLNASNAKLQMRRQNALSMFNNKHEDAKATRNARMRFFAWVAAVVVSFVVGVALIATGNARMYVAFALSVIAVATMLFCAFAIS